ncbi:hypothetical protein A2W14_00920 [Candidatus Gottesmanbacteria bacterium RBG_16_37_8]|uniref:DNA 3'-5' helicase n=1 Tax=Candidatus Gottesmanbacteria bacterium RBG_16_37_8 TaxID=1798371 RepID=A0A1F5YQB2_9BACT|nr:MAG: hypothetical protein A2W14_00920 [Candidatus Gottesmanbacteria bacterium RBG_16_37_8]
MVKNILKNLNPDQIKAVTSTEGPNLILAGAGSGKTRVLTYKVAYLIGEKKVRPENILMVTFTNKAAGEMKNRLQFLFDKNINSEAVLASTFHSFCARILRREGNFVNLSPYFVIYDDLDTKEAVAQAMDKLLISKKNFSPGAIAATIAQAKNELLSYGDYQQIAKGYFQETAAKVYPVYQNILLSNGAVDFEDLIYLTVKLFRDNPSVLKKYQEIFHYILIDEYQDTNNAQYTLSKLLSNSKKNITVVGDASQSIYAWRGADYRNILKFKEDYKDIKIFHLEKNYRSTQIILDAAHNIISKNQSHPVLKLWTEKNGGEKITIYEAGNEHDEANFIVDQLGSYELSDAAILYRTNAQSRIIEEALLHKGLAYVLVGGTRFYERKEIKDIISYLRLMVNPKDSVSIKRANKIGKKRLMEFTEYREKIIRSLSQLSTLELLDKILEVTKYTELYHKHVDEDLMRLENIKELRSVASEFPDLTLFLENVSLIEREYTADHPLDELSKNKKVTLMTMHSAKGLEFNVVFMVGMEEGLFPHTMSLLDPQELEEERRLCYVGITRARNKLILSYARRRLYFGQRASNAVSRFISELPNDLIDREGSYFL